MKMKGVPNNMHALGLTRLYIFALSLLAILSIAGQILIQWTLREGLQDAYIINMAGRQRMLSQKICKDILLLESESHSFKKAFLIDLKTTFYLWERHHYGLYHGNENLGLPGKNSEEVLKMFRELDPYFKDIASNVRKITADTMVNSPDAEVKEILSREQLFLDRMNAIVIQYEKEARAKVTSLMRTEFALLIFTLLILFLEGILIFKPAVVKLRKGFSDLRESENRTKEVNNLLMKTQAELRQTNLVLEKKVEERTEEILHKNRELEIKNGEILKVNKDLENFVYTASHDLKAPINNIEGLVEALSSEIPQESEGATGIVSMMKQSVSKFRNVLAELSDIGKLKVEASGQMLTVNFRDVLEEIKFSSKDFIDSAGANIEEDFSEAPAIRFSKKNLRSILYNLISNAIKYRAPDRKPSIHISSQRMDTYIVVTVKDNGMGIKKEDIPSIFSMYTRLTDQVEGTGLGLSIVRNIIDNNGGYIEVVSEPGNGTTFTIYFKI